MQIAKDKICVLLCCFLAAHVASATTHKNQNKHSAKLKKHRHHSKKSITIQSSSSTVKKHVAPLSSSTTVIRKVAPNSKINAMAPQNKVNASMHPKNEVDTVRKSLSLQTAWPTDKIPYRDGYSKDDHREGDEHNVTNLYDAIHRRHDVTNLHHVTQLHDEFINELQHATTRARTEPGAVVIDEEHATEFDQLRELLGIPSGDALTAKKMTSKTARRSTIGVDCERERRKLKTAKKFDSAKFAKLCPEEAKKEEFHQGKKVMDILARPVAKKKKDLNQQKKDFIDAVYKMVRASGPVPTLQFG